MARLRLPRALSSDHKVVARWYLGLGAVFLVVGGLMALNIRHAVAWPGRAAPVLGAVFQARTGGVVGPHEYLALFTMHGTVMLFFAVTPLVIGGVGNLVLPWLLGARGTAFPRLGALAFWLTAAGGAVLLAGLDAPLGGPSAGWTAYPPLSSRLGSPGAAQSAWCVAILLAGLGSALTAVNHVTTVVRLRAPGMGYFRMPLTAWGFFLTAVLTALFAPVLLAGTALLLVDRTLGTGYFAAGMAQAPAAAGDPLLYQHLFWVFGHPEVYILILPVWGVVSDLLSVFARKPAYGYRATVFALLGITALSALVYGHHMATAGLSPLLSGAFMTLTLAISVPSGVFFLNWLATLRGGAIRFAPPMLYALGVVVVFAVGGLSGLFLASVSTDVYLHDSFFVVGHFHFVLGAAVLLGFFAALHFWFPKAFGRQLHAGLARAHFALTLAGLLAVFGGMLWLGWAGMLRRLYDPSAYAFLAHLRGVNRAVSYAAFGLGAAQLLVVANVAWSLARGPRAADNPWDCATLEWSLPSPPPAHNFAAVPTVVRGPHAYAVAAPRDWLAQDEPGPEGS